MTHVSYLATVIVPAQAPLMCHVGVPYVRECIVEEKNFFYYLFIFLVSFIFPSLEHFQIFNDRANRRIILVISSWIIP